MRIVAISDIHGHTGGLQALQSELAAADLLIAAGDITHFGGAPEAAEVLDALLALAPRTVAVTGTCDPPAVGAYLEERGVGLDGRLRELDGVAFFGLGGSLPCPGPTPNEYTEEDYERILNGATSALPLVLVSHQPPYDTKLDMISTGLHVGSKSVRAFIEERRPAVCICGHIHEAYGVDRLGSTVIVNPGPFQLGGFACCDLSAGRAEITLKKISSRSARLRNPS